MNPAKAEIVLATLGGIQDDLKSQLKAAEIEQHRFEGAHKALLDASKNVESLNAHVNQDLQEGNFDIASAKLTVRYITRAVESLRNSAQNAQSSVVMAAGRVDAYRRIIENMSKKEEAQRAAIRSFMDAIDRGEVVMENGEPVHVGRPSARPPGTRPGGGNIAAQRRQEEAEAGVNSLIPGYDDLKVSDIKTAAEALPAKALVRILQHENENKGRASVRKHLEKLLESAE